MFERVASRFRVRERVTARFKQAVMQMPYQEALRVLGFPSSASPTDEEVNKRQREKARELHPDRGNDPKLLIEVNNAADAIRAYNARGTSSPSYGGPAYGGPTYTREPVPEQKDVEVTFEEAKAKANIPSDVKWWFVTESHSSGYSTDESTRRANGYVVVGETDSTWVFVTVEFYLQAYYYIGGGPKTDTCNIEVMRMSKKGPPTPALLYGGVLKAWGNFQYLEKKFNSKIRELPENWVFSERFPSSGSSTTIKKLLADKGLLSEEQAATIKTTVELELDTALSEKPGYHPEPTPAGKEPHDWYKVTLWINGRAYPLSEKDTQRLFVVTPYGAVSKFFNAVFGTYWRNGAKKVLTRARKGKELILWLADKLTDLPPAAVEGLRATAARLK